MFPDRVGRVILDGVVDADYYVAPLWYQSVIDADSVHESFFTYCAQAGASKCDIARQGDSAEDIKKRVYADLEALQKQSLVGVNPVTKTPSIITWSWLKAIMFSGLYFPVAFFPIQAQVLDLLHKGEYDTLHAALPQMHSIMRYQPYCGPHLPSSFDVGDAPYTIMCADKRYTLNESVPNLQQRFETMSLNSSFADVWMTVMLGCDGWAVEPVGPPMRWDDHPAHKQKPIKTNFPLLFVSTSYDPVCPLYAAVKMAKKFEGAGLIEQRSEGHCSISAISICTIATMRAYIQDGIVPSPPKLEDGQNLREGKWTRCDADERPWHPFGEETNLSALETNAGRQILEEVGMTPEKAVEMLQAWQGMQEYFAKQSKPAFAPGIAKLDLSAVKTRLERHSS